MNQPTRDEFEQLKEEVRKIREQQTEPIQITVERKYPDRELLQEGLRKQDEHFNHLKGELESLSIKQNEHAKGLISHSRSVDALQTEMRGVRADILAIRESQVDFRDKLEDIAKDVSGMKREIVGMKREIVGMKGEVSGIKGEVSGIKGEISGIKGEISGIKGEISGIKTTLAEILNRLPPKQ